MHNHLNTQAYNAIINNFNVLLNERVGLLKSIVYVVARNRQKAWFDEITKYKLVKNVFLFFSASFDSKSTPDCVMSACIIYIILNASFNEPCVRSIYCGPSGRLYMLTKHFCYAVCLVSSPFVSSMLCI